MIIGYTNSIDFHLEVSAEDFFRCSCVTCLSMLMMLSVVKAHFLVRQFWTERYEWQGVKPSFVRFREQFNKTGTQCCDNSHTHSEQWPP